MGANEIRMRLKALKVMEDYFLITRVIEADRRPVSA